MSLINEDIQSFLGLLKKANKPQLKALRIEIESEIKRREQNAKTM